jgi:ABC-type transporter Mla subunit MlaD
MRSSMSSIEDLIKINTEYTHLDSFLSQILHAVGVADDAQFKQATGALKAQVGTLTADIESINKVIKNVATAGKIAGFLAKAVQLIGTV